MSFEDLTRDRVMRIRLDITVPKPAGRGQQWTAEAGPWRSDGAGEKAAVDALADRLRRFLVDYREPVVLSFRGWTAVLSPALASDFYPRCWTEQLLGPDGRTRHRTFAADNWQDARARTCCQLASRGTDCHDDASVHAAAAYLRQQSIPHDQGFGPARCIAPQRGNAPPKPLSAPAATNGTSGPANIIATSPWRPPMTNQSCHRLRGLDHA